MINDKRCLEFKRIKEENMGGFGGRNGRDKCCNYIIISKNKGKKGKGKNKMAPVTHSLFQKRGAEETLGNSLV